MPRKTPLFGFNLFWHDEPIISIEDVNPNSSYGGALQADSQNTLNFNFKRMDFVLQSILDGTLAFNSLRTTQDVIAGRDVVVGRNLNIQGSLQLPRDETPTPHVVLDFGDALAYAGRNDKNLSVTLNGVTNNQDERFNAFTAENDTFDVQGANIYPARFVVSHADKLWETDVSAVARLLLVFDRVPTGLSNVTVEYSYDGITFPLSQTFLDSQLIGNASYLSEPMVVSQDVKAVRITLNGTNAGSNEFGIRRIALLSPAVPALKDVHADAVDPHVYGTVMLQGTTLAEVFGTTTNIGDDEQNLNLRGESLTFNNKKVWHEAEQGEGSGLDADTLDGVHASEVLLRDGSQALTGHLLVNAGVTIDGVDLSALLAAFNSHTHNGTDTQSLHAIDILAENDGIETNVQSLIEALNNRIDLLSSGGTSLELLDAQEVNTVALNVSGSATLASLTSSGAATVNSKLTVARAHSADLLSLDNSSHATKMVTRFNSNNVFGFVPYKGGSLQESKRLAYDFGSDRWVFDEVPYVGSNPVFHAGNLDLSDVSGDFGVDGGTFVVNASTNRVGVGTPSPATPLEVVGTVRATDFETSGGSLSLSFNGGANLAFRSTRAASWLDTQDAVFFQVGDGNDKIVFTGQYGALASRMQFTTSAFQVAANTHDGTPAPTGLFEVVNSTGQVQLRVTPNDGIETHTVEAASGLFQEINLEGLERIAFGSSNDIYASGNTILVRPGLSTSYTFSSDALTTSTGLSRFANGSAASPTFSFQSDTNTGMYRDGADILAFATGGTKRAQFDANGLTVQQYVRLNGTSYGFSWVDDTDTGLFRTSSNTLRLRAGNQDRLTVTSSGVTVTGYLVIPEV